MRNFDELGQNPFDVEQSATYDKKGWKKDEETLTKGIECVHCEYVLKNCKGHKRGIECLNFKERK